MILQDYLDLITSEHQDKPNFVATITAAVQVLIQIQDLLSSMGPIFDLDIAVGDQLDIIGQWAGISRTVSIPIDNVYFTWDGDFSLGWDFGSWQPATAPANITVLPDDAYRTLIRGKIAANNWNGTTDGAYAIWDSIFPDVTILIQDNQDMSYDLALVGGIIDSLTLALLTGGYIPLKPEGVRVNTYYVPIDSNPIFGWDLENDLVSGWDEGTWPREVAPT